MPPLPLVTSDFGRSWDRCLGILGRGWGGFVVCNVTVRSAGGLLALMGGGGGAEPDTGQTQRSGQGSSQHQHACLPSGQVRSTEHWDRSVCECYVTSSAWNGRRKGSWGGVGTVNTFVYLFHGLSFVGRKGKAVNDFASFTNKDYVSSSETRLPRSLCPLREPQLYIVLSNLRRRSQFVNLSSEPAVER